MTRSTTPTGLMMALLALSMTLFVSACKTAEKHLLEGNYEAALDEALEFLSKGKKKKRDETILVLEHAYRLAWERDQQELAILDAQGMAAGWMDKLSIYEAVQYRQDRLRPFLPLYIRSEHRHAEFNLVDVTAEIAEARLEVSAYLYGEASALLESADMYDARDAFAMLEKLESISGSYQDSRALKQHARELGTMQVVVSVRSIAAPLLPHTVIKELKTANLSPLEDFWTAYSNGAPEPGAGPADFRIDVRLMCAEVSPGRTQELHFRETSEVEDGVKYVKGEGKDNVDTVIAYRTIYADVIRTTQVKTARICGTVEYRNPAGRMVETFPVEALLEFSNAFSRATGNLDALTDQTRAELNGGMLPYPNDMVMLVDAGKIFETEMIRSLSAHQDIIQ